MSGFLKIFNEKSVVVIKYLLALILLVTMVAVIVPLIPKMPALSLDESWVFGMNQAVAQGLVFGKDIIFTFGPYASIYTISYHPETDHLMVFGSLYLALAYWMGLLLLIKKVQFKWILSLLLVFAGIMYSRDALLFVMPLILGLVIYKELFDLNEDKFSRKGKLIYLTFLFSTLGLLPLIKGSFLILSFAVIAMSAPFCIKQKQKELAYISILSPLFAMFGFWILSGQPFVALFSYLINIFPIISGYTEAMALTGDTNEVFYYLMASVILLLAVLVNKNIQLTPKIFLLLLFSLYLFVAFKAGFVRHDGHAIISSTALLTAAFLLPLILNTNFIFYITTLALFAWMSIDGHYIKTTTNGFLNNISNTYSNAIKGLETRVNNPNKLSSDFEKAISELKERSGIPILEGTADIYSYNQSSLIASGNKWSPRPILQSYSVYTASLNKINNEHLEGKDAPKNIIFSIQPIDGKLPAIEDGGSWLTLLNAYKPKEIENDFLYLKRVDSREVMETKYGDAQQEMYKLGESINVPSNNDLVFAKIEIKKSFFGKLLSLFFKPTTLEIKLVLITGEEKSFRIVSGMVGSEFLLSPLIENTAEFAMLYDSNPLLNSKLIKSFSINSSDQNKWKVWESLFSVTFSKAMGERKLHSILSLDKFEMAGNLFQNIEVSDKCRGSIDKVNGSVLAPPYEIRGSNMLHVNGWLIASFDDQKPADAVYLLLKNEKGELKFLSVKITPRPDVGAYFKNHKFDNSGFNAVADTSDLSGEWMLQIAEKSNGQIKLCSQFVNKVVFK